MTLSTASSFQNGLILLLGVVGLTFYSLLLVRRNRRRSQAGERRMQERIAELRAQSDLRGSMEGLLLQLEEVSRRVNAQLDTKFARLEAVVRDADDRIARLEQLLSAVPPGGSEEAASSKRDPGNLSRGSNPEPTAAAQFDGSPAETPRLHPDVRRIQELARGGLPPIRIAERLGLPLGEVELALRLPRGE